MSAAEIAEWLVRNLPVEPETVEDLTDRYIYLIALAQKEPREYLRFLDELPTRTLEWGNELKAMMRSSARNTTRADIPLSPRVAKPATDLWLAPKRLDQKSATKQIQIIIPGA